MTTGAGCPQCHRRKPVTAMRCGRCQARRDAWPQLACLKGHTMLWLGVCYWLCARCRMIYLETVRPFTFRKAGW